jgi:hypothetical protein
MRNVKTLMVALVAVFAFSAVAASAASATAPEFTVACHKVTAGTGGAYPTKAACEKGEKMGESPEEWLPNKFTSESGKGKLVSKNGSNEVECTSDTNVGEIRAPKEGVVTVTFKGCFTEGAPADTCQSGTVAGEVVTNLLKFTLGFIDESKVATTKTGLLLKPAEEGGLFAKFQCKVAGKERPVEAKGSVIGEITPKEAITTKFELKLEAGANRGEEKFTELGGKKAKLESSLNGGVFEETSEETTDKLVTAEATEIT